MAERRAYPVASQAVDDRRFDVASLTADQGWKLDAPDTLLRERSQLAEWAAEQADPVAGYQPGRIDLPEVAALAEAIQFQLDSRFGVAWVTGMPVQGDPLAASLLYLAVGASLGEVVETYRRLYDVMDQGQSYKTSAIPVSQTRESTGMHTDSSRKDNCPDYVGLLCQTPARSGGGSRITSAAQVHEALRRRVPRLRGGGRLDGLQPVNYLRNLFDGDHGHDGWRPLLTAAAAAPGRRAGRRDRP